MSGRTKKYLKIAGIALASLIVVVIITALVIVRTDWFRDYVRQQIITQTEQSTGGTVEVGSFAFSWWPLEAVITDFVIHGNERAGAAPFVRIPRLQVNLRLFTSLKRIYEITYLGVNSPQANIIVLPDGRTNIPSPKQKSTSNESGLASVVDLAVANFDLKNGVFTFNDQQTPISARGENLTAELDYNFVSSSYSGRFSVNPLRMVQGHNVPLDLSVTLPVTLERDRIQFTDAKLGTANSELHINATVDNMDSPRTTARLNGHISLLDVKNAANAPLDLRAPNAPQMIDVDANAYIDNNRITVTSARLTVGQSKVEASGTLKDPNGNAALQFRAGLDLGQIGRLARVSVRPDGTVQANGVAKLDANNNYQVSGNVEARNLAFTEGTNRIRNVNLYSAVSADPQKIELSGLRLSAFGGEFAGNAGIENMQRFHLDGNLRNFDIQTAARTFGEAKFPYDGIISGPVQAQGDLKAPGTKGIQGRVQLAIAPGRHGIPVSGHLAADYNGAADNITVANSFINLPHTHITLSGSTARSLQVQLTSKNLNDLLAAAGPVSNPPPVVLTNGGVATVNAGITGALTTPHITGHLAMNSFSAQDRHFDALSADIAASPSGASVLNGSLTSRTLNARFDASTGLRNWQTKPYLPVAADLTLQNGDLADVVALAGTKSVTASGTLNANARIRGTLGDPTGSASLSVMNGAIDDQPFDRIQAQVNLSDQLLTIPAAYVVAGSERVDLTASFRHPRDSFSTGTIQAHVATNQVSLAGLRGVQKLRPNTAGTVQINADVAGNLGQSAKGTEFMLTAVNGDVSARGLRLDNQNYGDLNATARTSGNSVTYQLTSDFAGSNTRVNGTTTLARDYPTRANASVSNLPIERVLAVAQRTDIPAKGNLSATAEVNGTIDDPNATADVTITKALIYDEPIDRAETKIAYTGQEINVPMLQIVSGPSRIDMSADYTHPRGDLETGHLRFKVDSSEIQLANIRNVQERRQGLGGTLKIAANGDATVEKPGAPARIGFADLNANVSATGITANHQNFGDLNLVAHTTGGNLQFALDSDIAGSDIHGRGTAGLRGDYPVNAQLSFKNITWSRLRDLIGSEPPGTEQTLEAAVDGNATVNGPATKVDELRGTLDLTRLQVSTKPATAGGRPITIVNDGPISLALNRSVVTIRGAHLTGPSTDIRATGTVAINNAEPLNLTVNANTDLKLVQDFDRDFYSSGAITLAATVHGTFSEPLVNGRLELHNANVNYIDFPNGIANANGVILFNGNNATIQTLTGESGGGKVALTGFVGFSPAVRYGLKATASNVRVRQQGASVITSANVNLTGTPNRGLASGTVTVESVTFNPRSDLGSMLMTSAPPVQAPAAPSPILASLKLDIHIRTSPALAVQSSLAQNIQAAADLRLRGTAAEPGLLGRINITEGNIVFFGTKYTVNRGVVAFYNPFRIDPTLDISLETKTQGVDVVLNVTGPIDNMNLSYSSDPPLQFQQIVSLLAAGTTPTTDPTLVANEPTTPPQTYQQMGESAILGQAVANPVSSQLQRVFGISQLKIDPSFISGSALPQARMTLQQQITPSVTFTYVTNLANPNDLLISIEWALDPKWSAVATRDEFGHFGVEFFYKKQIR